MLASILIIIGFFAVAVICAAIIGSKSDRDIERALNNQNREKENAKSDPHHNHTPHADGIPRSKPVRKIGGSRPAESEFYKKKYFTDDNLRRMGVEDSQRVARFKSRVDNSPII